MARQTAWFDVDMPVEQLRVVSGEEKELFLEYIGTLYPVKPEFFGRNIKKTPQITLFSHMLDGLPVYYENRSLCFTIAVDKTEDNEWIINLLNFSSNGWEPLIGWEMKSSNLELQEKVGDILYRTKYDTFQLKVV